MFRDIATYGFNDEASLTLQEHHCENYKSSHLKVVFFFPSTTSSPQLIGQGTISIIQDMFAVGQETLLNPYPTAFPYGNGMVLHFYQQQESSTTKTVHKVINKGLKTYV